MSFLPAELIKKKRNGLSHSRDELQFIVNGFLNGELPDYQMSAWLMSVFFKGMDPNETAALTDIMLKSGRTLDFSNLSGLTVDKHSTGGVGDKTSMILAPIAAAAGARVPMIAGRGLGHTGGTLDKLESIPGFRINLTLEEFQEQVERIGVAIIGQTAEICPADKKIYALRDVTATVESLPLICASIMSKKLAEGIGGLVLDVKFGSGAFMKTIEAADTLAEKLMAIGSAHNKRVAAFLTNMEQPLGRFIGNTLEIGECVAILKNEAYLSVAPESFTDCRELSLELAGSMIWLSGRSTSHAEGLALAREALDSGAAWSKFQELCSAQGGDLSRLPTPRSCLEVRTEQSGFVSALNTEMIGIAAIVLGAGRLKTTDSIDSNAGIRIHKKIGEAVKEGEILYTLYASGSGDDPQVQRSRRMLLDATTISLQKTDVPDLIARRKVN
jgi:pyrimidine-nucleoside phosphorylase